MGEGVRQKYVQRQPWVIAAVLMWVALHDRPDRLPAASTTSRRAKRAGFAVFLNAVSERSRGAGLQGLVLAVDGNPLLVGGCPHDPDARFGRAAGEVGGRAEAGDLGVITAVGAQVLAGANEAEALVSPRGAGARVHAPAVLQGVDGGAGALDLGLFSVCELGGHEEGFRAQGRCKRKQRR